MTNVSEQFVEAFVAALPTNYAIERGSSNRDFAEAFGVALQSVMGPRTETHTHYHPPEGSVMHVVGEVVQIMPWPDDGAIKRAGDMIDGWDDRGKSGADVVRAVLDALRAEAG